MAANLSDIRPADRFPAMLEKFKGEIARALPQHMNADRMARIALTAFRLNPKLGECDPRSVMAAVIQSSQLGLEIGINGMAYLVPYEKRKKVNGQWQTVSVECQFIPGWKGLVDLANRSGRVAVWTGAVFSGDDFDYRLGVKPDIIHRPMGGFNPKDMTHVYAVGWIKDAMFPIIEVWPISRVWKHRDQFNKVGNNHYSYENEEMYARKVALLQVLKYLPSTPELNQAIALNDAAEVGAQGLNVKDVIEGTWAPGASEPEATGADKPKSEKAPGGTDDRDPGDLASQEEAAGMFGGR